MHHAAPRPCPSALLVLLGAAVMGAGSGGLRTAQAAPTASTAPADPERRLPLGMEADSVSGRPDGVTEARGTVRAGQGTIRLDTPVLRYDAMSGLVTVEGGGVRWARGRDLLEAQSGQWQSNQAVGEFNQPRFFFGTALAGGRGSRLAILEGNRVEILDARMTSCLVDDQGAPLREPGTPRVRQPAPAQQNPLGTTPEEVGARLRMTSALPAPPGTRQDSAWELRSPRITLDFDRQEGVAEQAQLRFLDVPVMMLPRFSFPLGEARRSGWLPPSARADTRSGVEVSAPYYFNIAPNQDATVTPALAVRRGPSAEFEYRYLWTEHSGQIQAHAVPHDSQLGRSRGAINWRHQWTGSDWNVRTHGIRVSDDRYWKDFSYTQTYRRQADSSMDSLGVVAQPADGIQGSLQPRLPSQTLQAERVWSWGPVFGTAYSRVLHWQPLQGTNPDEAFISPYQRSPQVGSTLTTRLPLGIDLAVESEVNRFTRPEVTLNLAPQLHDGLRWHALGSISRPWVGAAGWLIPRLSLNSASYRLDEAPTVTRTSFSRTIPTLSVDSGLNFERRWQWGPRELVQTLEPRVVYVNTPMRDQRDLPNFDAAAKEFNTTSIFSENAFSGVDRVSDAHQVTLGMTSRSLDARTGAEMLRGSIAQRLQFRDQTTTPAGTVANQRVSDVLLAATVGLSPIWGADSTMQYSPDLQRVTRSVLALRYTPGPGQTVIAAYRYARDLAETVEVRVNWPLWRATENRSAGRSEACTMLVTGATRLNYNTRESRMADSLLGVEVDSGCWVARLGVQRQSTGVTEEVTRLLLQLELTGLTRPRISPLRF